MRLHWLGPFSLTARPNRELVYDTPEAACPGVYLWTIPRGSEYLVNYVGMSSSGIGRRQQAHVQGYLAGKFWVYDPGKFKEGEKEKAYAPADGFTKFIEYGPGVCETLWSFLSVFEVFVAEVQEEKTLIERIESALIRQLQSAPPPASSFLDNYRVSRNASDVAQITIALNGSPGFLGLDGELHV